MPPIRLAVALLAAALLPSAVLAAGAHESVGCFGCHGGKGTQSFAVAPNTKALDPGTKQPYSGTTALCLACHAEREQGGQGYAPISQHVSHPFYVASVNARVARVPAELLRERSRFECISCHDPHPSNPNYKYLRADVGAKGKKMDRFCGVCHPVKADPTAEKVELFTSMNEGGRPASAREAPPPEKPAVRPGK